MKLDAPSATTSSCCLAVSWKETATTGGAWSHLEMFLLQRLLALHLSSQSAPAGFRHTQPSASWTLHDAAQIYPSLIPSQLISWQPWFPSRQSLCTENFLLRPFLKVPCSPVSCCPVVPRTSPRLWRRCRKVPQLQLFQKQVPKGPRMPGCATCPRIGGGIALLPVSLQLNASGTELPAMGLPFSHLFWELLMLLKNSADHFPLSPLDDTAVTIRLILHCFTRRVFPR